ncbi:MAG TPA: methyltransferase [Planctomycetaceae bacterium]|jgi:SAM-dependent methyltransferase|nr:methyltransferase [Planctomycetaceae bacterium]
MSLSPQQQLNQLICGYWHSQCVYVAAKLGIADLLANGPESVDDLAQKTGTHRPSLFRLLRALASLGVFGEESGQRFRLTPAAEPLRRDVPGSQWAMAVMMGEEHFRAWGELLYCVRTGKIGFDKVFGRPVFEFLSQNPEQAAIFDQAMVGVHGRETSAMLDAYDFSSFASVADIGGGNGTTLSGILKRHPAIHGTLFDLPGVIQRAGAGVEASGLSNRIHLVAGDFFDSVPGGADAYVLRHIIHDWEPDKAIRILSNVRQALGEKGRVLVVESVIPPGNEPFFGKLLDLTMLVIPGGQERTAEEYADLFGKAGLRLVRIVPTNTEVSVIEGVAA